MKHEEITREIIGSAMEVLNQLKPGLDEKLYERALCIELTERELSAEQQKRYPVTYRDQSIGSLVPDLVVAEKVVVETKVVTCFNENHVSQAIGYLAITGLEVALLINFKHAKLDWKRIVR